MYRRLVRPSSAIAIAVCAGVLSACGDSGAGVATSTPATALMQAQRRTVSSASAQSAAGKVAFAIGIRPKQATAKGGRRPAFVSPSTESMQILVNGIDPVVVNLTPGSPNCTSHNMPPGSYICSAFVNAPDGNDVFTVTTYDRPNGQGSVLSTNTTGTVNVKPNVTNRISIVLDGVVEKAALALTTPNPPAGTPAVIGLSVIFADADNNLIVGPASFDYPVTLTTSDSVNGALSKTVLDSAADAAGITVNYSGAKVTTITFSATAPDLPAANVLPGVLTPGATNGPQHLYVPYVAGQCVPSVCAGILVYNLGDLSAAPTLIIRGGYRSAFGLAVDSSDRFYTYDDSQANISVFDLAHRNARLPTIPYQGYPPAWFAADPHGRLYATSAYAPIVSVFDTANDDLRLTPISANLNNPHGLALDARGKLYVANSPRQGSASISVFDTTRGNAPLPSIAGGGLSFPDGAAVDASGKLYVANDVNSVGYPPGHISVFDTLHGNAALPEITGGGLYLPFGVAVDATGKLYVQNNTIDGVTTVNVFDTLHDNKLLTVITLPYSGSATAIAVH